MPDHASDLSEKLRALLGPEALVMRPGEATEAGSAPDSAADSWLGRVPDLVVRPVGEEQAKELLNWASANGTPVYPRGGGTRWASAFHPFRGGIALETSALGEVVQVDEANLTVTAGAGLSLASLRKALGERGLFYPLEPLHPGRSTLGGCIATNSSGPRKCGYGSLRGHLLGCRAVFPDGSGGTFGGNQVKNVSGYGVRSLLCGSWGTLGLITQVILKVRPRPLASRTVVLAGDTESILDAAEAARKGLYGASAIEVLIGRAAVKFAGRLSFAISRPERAAAAAVVGLDGVEPDVLAGEDWLRSLARSARLDWVYPEPEASEAWEARSGLTRDYSNDLWHLSVPPASLAEVLKRVWDLGADPINGPGPVGIVGHAGTGEAHLLVGPAGGSPPTAPDAGASPPLPNIAALVKAFKGQLIPDDPACSGGLIVGSGARGLDRVWRSLKHQIDPARVMSPASRVGARA